jgi:hypothetical protein
LAATNGVLGDVCAEKPLNTERCDCNPKGPRSKKNVISSTKTPSRKDQASIGDTPPLSNFNHLSVFYLLPPGCLGAFVLTGSSRPGKNVDGSDTEFTETLWLQVKSLWEHRGHGDATSSVQVSAHKAEIFAPGEEGGR